MILNFNEKVLKALVALQSNTDFQTFLVDGLAEQLDKAMEPILFAPDEKFNHSDRGVAKALTMILQSVEGAREELNKFNQSK
jgi:hypothetical protein